MAYNMVRRQVREINRRIFANDIFYVDNESNDIFRSLLSTIIQTFSPEDMLSNTPTILEVKDNNITMDTLDKIKLLSKRSVYLQFNNRVLADSNKLSIIRTLKESGYNIIIEVNKDDTMFTIAKVLANIVKFNIKSIPEALAHGSDMFQCKTLAYNVNTPEDYVLAESAGITLYEGEYISESASFKVNGTQHSNVGFIELLCMLSNKTVNIQEVIKLISQDSLLTSQVLRLANSNYFKADRSTSSIGEAVVRIGIQSLKQWIFLLEFGRNDNPREDVLEVAYYRAKFCEAIAIETRGAFIKPSEAYLIGLMSELDILTGRPIAVELSSLNLTRMIEDALIYRDNAGGAILNMIISFEESNKDRVEKYCNMLKIKKEKVNNIYCKAVMDAKNTWRDMTEYGGVYL